MVVWGCGRAFLATASLAGIRTSSLGDEAGGSEGAGSGSLGGASVFILALMTVSSSFAPERWNRRDPHRDVFADPPGEGFICPFVLVPSQNPHKHFHSHRWNLEVTTF